MMKILASPTRAFTSFTRKYHPELPRNPDDSTVDNRRMMDPQTTVSARDLAKILADAKPNISAKNADKCVKLAIRNIGTVGISALPDDATWNGAAIVARVWPSLPTVAFQISGFIMGRAFLENSLALAKLNGGVPTTVDGLSALLHSHATLYGRSLALRTDLARDYAVGHAIDPLMYTGLPLPGATPVVVPAVETAPATVETVENVEILGDDDETPDISGETPDTRTAKQLRAALGAAGVETHKRANRVELLALAAKHGC